MAERSTVYRTAPEATDRMPKGVPYIIGNEVAERFSFYGMKAILFAFMTRYLMTSSGEPAYMTESQATEYMAWFTAAAYFFPVVGALIADTIWGKYKTILYLSLFYCFGHGLLALMDMPQPFLEATLEPKTFMIAGLALIAFGAGGIKSCVSANVGDQFGESNKHLLPKVFGWFYMAINGGSLVATFLIPELLDAYGPGVAFAVPGVLMGVATFVFWLGRRKFVHVPPTGSGFLKESLSRDGLIALGKLIPLYLFMAVFWSLYDQSPSKWVGQAERMDLRLDLGFWQKTLLPEQVQTVNPLLILLLIPLFGFVVYPTVGKFARVTPLRKIGAGFLLGAGAFVLSAQIERWIDAGETPTFWWQVLAYVLLTAAEVLVSITALEFSYTQAPRRMKSFVMGLYFLSMTIGNAFIALFNRYTTDEAGESVLSGPSYYMTFVYIMLVATALYLVFAWFYREKEYLQDEGRV